MRVAGFLVSCLSLMHIASGILLKHLAEHKPPGFLEILKKPPKLPLVNIHVSKGPGIFGAGGSIGSFGFGFGFGGQYVPPGQGGPVIPPKLPDEEIHIPDDLPPQVPRPKPLPPVSTWDDDKGGWPRPSWEEEGPKRGSYGGDEIGHPKRVDSYEEEVAKKLDGLPDWEDIGEKVPDSKSEDFMDGELVEKGLIQPRLNRRRNRRFIESHVYHVPLLFRSNAKPFQVKVQSSLNGLSKRDPEK